MRKDGAMIVPSVKYNISEESINDYQFVSTLHIKSLNADDFAQYICVAKNTIGKSEELIKIYEIEREIRTTEEMTTKSSYKYEEYHTQPSYNFNKNIKNEDSNASNQKKEIPQEKKNYLDTSSFKYGYETGGRFRSGSSKLPQLHSILVILVLLVKYC